MATADLVNLFSFARNIEISEAKKGSNVSCFLLQYDVEPPNFTDFKMKLTSDYVRRYLRNDMKVAALHRCIRTHSVVGE